MGDNAKTTNAHDLQEAANLQARLSEYNNQAQTAAVAPKNSTFSDDAIPSVSIDDGAYKYVLITANTPSNRARIFVYSKRNASYHRDVAEYLLPQLEGEGYSEILIKGGGRILRDEEEKRIHIFGYSYGFGQADHALAKEIVEKSVNFQGYKVTWSNDGY
mmetsp:Transcript_14693/g.31923  ORF Transcript_14693/g.31923 Transcript_14693/m.31923 type:complete len:160 (+) Transcript_14693:248-727(+)|eukprot:CAMPEP_0172316998 /NCGR_PEP_ID=MMETSP1058-20130122/30220_1 /TAXON_ID=83371 /ORGANISM="Detonula confervacea, Strain CCMP 353" /LENGTH=159 /DNA_ID=CAMNT_0013031445 /DNA_START=169 /DNA_END=648 /DNA_ORIENTATION=+